MTNARNKEFDRGYLLACATIVNNYGSITTAADTLNASEIKRSDIPGFDLSEYDQVAIDEILADPRCAIPD
jgi:hypothetical protein